MSFAVQDFGLPQFVSAVASMVLTYEHDLFMGSSWFTLPLSVAQMCATEVRAQRRPRDFCLVVEARASIIAFLHFRAGGSVLSGYKSNRREGPHRHTHF